MRKHRNGLVIFLIIIALLIAMPAYAETNSVSVASDNIASKNFWALNQTLNIYQTATRYSWDIIPDEPYLLKQGIKSATILLLRDRLKLSGDLRSYNDIGGRRFDALLARAVKIFQMRHGLKADGVVGKDTRAELNVAPEERIKQIAINMERWAELASKVGDRFIIVNIPDFHMFLYDHNKKLLSLRAIVGKPELPTPELYSKITRIVFNPYWNVPVKIAQNDIIPKILADPNYIYKMHMKVLTSQTDDAKTINPNNIDWYSAYVNGFNYHIRQEPGPDNALGLVKFEFQNSHDVYMHDTSAKDLFNTDNRDYSHGCIRVENPFALVQYLLNEDPKWNDWRIQEVIDIGKTKYVKVPRPIPIFITYITAWVDDDGYINFRHDLYQMDDHFGNTLDSTDSVGVTY